MERAITLQQLLKGLWRRRLLLLVTFGAVLIVAAGVVLAVPSTYRATTVVRVEPLRPVIELVQASVTAPVEERLKTVAQELFARPLLEKTIEALDLEAELRKSKGMEAAVEELRAHLDVKVEGEAAFVLAVTGKDPKAVAAVANLLPKLYAEEALAVRTRQAEDTSALFDEELAKLSTQVQGREVAIGAFKLQHLGELPEQAEANMRSLDRIMAQITARIDARRELQRRQVELAASHYDAETELGRLKRRELDLQHAQLDAQSQWTADHPEVQRLQREMGSLGARREVLEAQGLAENRERTQVRRQLVQLEKELASLAKEAETYRGRLDRTPQWGQQLSDLSRDYEILRTKYQSLVSRKVEAEVARELEAKARATMFRVLSPASEPIAPFKPDRASGLLLALLGALGAAVALGSFLTIQDDSMRGAEQARELKMPVLALVPKMPARGAR